MEKAVGNVEEREDASRRSRGRHPGPRVLLVLHRETNLAFRENSSREEGIVARVLEQRAGTLHRPFLKQAHPMTYPVIVTPWGALSSPSLTRDVILL